MFEPDLELEDNNPAVSLYEELCFLYILRDGGFDVDTQLLDITEAIDGMSLS